MRGSTGWLALPLVVVLLVQAGCGPSGGGRGSDAKATALTPAEYFKKNQQSTMTTHGKIDIDSVRDEGDGIVYQTKDGKSWRVTYSKRPDGTYEYNTPEATKLTR